MLLPETVASLAINFSTKSMLSDSHLYGLVGLYYIVHGFGPLMKYYCASLARLYFELHFGLTQPGKFCCFLRCNQYCHHRAIYFIWCVPPDFCCKWRVARDNVCLFAGIPIALRVINRDDFVRGPFHLGAFSYPVAVAAVMWIVFITIAFILPELNVSQRSSGQLANLI